MKHFSHFTYIKFIFTKLIFFFLSGIFICHYNIIPKEEVK